MLQSESEIVTEIAKEEISAQELAILENIQKKVL